VASAVYRDRVYAGIGRLRLNARRVQSKVVGRPTCGIIVNDTKAEFERGWAAALLAVRGWHASKANQAIVQSTRMRFPKNLEREAEFHRKSAEMIMTLSPDDV
jgi:hypothetical protein